MRNKILITGANGFVGSSLVEALAGRPLVLLGRKRPVTNVPHAFYFVDFIRETYVSAFENVDCVIHCAGRAAIGKGPIAEAEINEINVEGTLHLARQAADAGVRRFIFLSSAKVYGESSPVNQPFRVDNLPRPEDAYARSKVASEKGLEDISRQSNMEVVIIRPAMVYGPGVGGNFLAMYRGISWGLPLPCANMDQNLRSMVYIGNLVGLIVATIVHPGAAKGTFNVCDGEDFSTRHLLEKIAVAGGYRLRLLPVPLAWMQVVFKLLRREQILNRLTQNFQLDLLATSGTLGWNPKFTSEEGLKSTIEAIKDFNSSKCMSSAWPRIFDILLVIVSLPIAVPLFLLLWLILFLSSGSPLFFQRRVGLRQKQFTLLKFRTMHKCTPSVASHLASADSVTGLGKFLRKTKLDEVPQLWNVFKGDMSLVGPRPCLESQVELIDHRHRRGVFQVRPGVTGLAQLNNIDMSTPAELAEVDQQMIRRFSLKNYFLYILQTALGKGRGDRLRL